MALKIIYAEKVETVWSYEQIEGTMTGVITLHTILCSLKHEK